MTENGRTVRRLDVACHANILVADVSPETFPGALTAIAAAGFSSVVLPPLDPATTDVDALRAALRDSGLAPITIAGGISPATDVGSPDAGVRAAGAALLRSVVDLTAALAGDQLNGVPYGMFGHPQAVTSPESFERAAREVGAVADYAHQRGITMTFEVLNRYETSVVNTAEQAMRFVALSGSEHLRIHLDTFHMAIEESDLIGAIRTALPKLGYLELGQSGRGLLSTGAVDIAEIVRQALDLGYRGRIGIEAFSREILLPEVGDMLAIWRSPYADGVEVARDAWAVIDRGWTNRGEALMANRP
jgi:D-psicose/D-tagatose/L-ribulose 3-epimerase